MAAVDLGDVQSEGTSTTTVDLLYLFVMAPIGGSSSTTMDFHIPKSLSDFLFGRERELTANGIMKRSSSLEAAVHTAVVTGTSTAASPFITTPLFSIMADGYSATLGPVTT